MMSWTSFSQDTPRTKAVKISVLKAIKKDLDKCDSLKVAYDSKTLLFDNMVKRNLSLFDEIQKQQSKRELLQKQLDQSVKALRKKKNNWLLPTAIGIVGGIVTGVIISN